MSVPDRAMKLKDGKIIADQLMNMIAVQFAQDTENAAGTYVIYNGDVFYLPYGHAADVAWADTVKEGPKDLGSAVSGMESGKAPVIISSASGNPVVIPDGAEGMPVKGLKINLLPRQDGVGDAEPDNVRMPFPWTDVNLFKTKKNMFDVSTMVTGYWINGSGLYDEDVRGAFTMNIPVNGNEHMVFSCNGEEFPLSMEVVEFGDDGFIKRNYATVPSTSVVPPDTISFTVSESTKYVVCAVYNVAQAPLDLEKIESYMMQLEISDTATAYTSYAGPSTEITFDAIYGGWIDLATGEVWQGFDVAYLSTLPLYMASSGNFAFTNFPFGDRTKFMCNVYKTVAYSYWDQMPNLSIMGTPDGNNIFRIRNDAFTTEASFKTHLAEIGAILVYPLVTPILIGTIDPVQLYTLKGLNTIWSDGNGDLEIEYCADTKQYVDSSGGADVQINGVSIVENGVANLLPLGEQLGLARISSGYGITASELGRLAIDRASEAQLKAGVALYRPIAPVSQHISAFYGLAKVAGADMASSSNAVGTYTEAAMEAIQKMLGLDGVLGDYETTNTASKAYAIGDAFIYNGKRYIATSAIALNDVIAPGTNCALAPLNGNYAADVRVNNSSVVQNGVANIPKASTTGFGVVKLSSTYGIVDINGTLRTLVADDSTVKNGANGYHVICPSIQHQATFYGLAKAAGDTTQKSSNVFGVYTDSAKEAIQKMLGLDGILGDYETTSTASKAYAIGDTFIYNGNRYKVTAAIALDDAITPGTNCELDPLDGRYIRDTDKASTQKRGVIKVNPWYGTAVDNDTLYINGASDSDIKTATQAYKPITPSSQHRSVFFGLAKAANVDLANETVTFGTYPQTAKAAIQTMLGIEADVPLIETLTGSTLSIVGMPNVRYICETAISELTITPPASGSIVVRFTAGANCIVVLPQTVKFPAWFDISSLESGTTYEIIITDGVYGGAMSWA